MTSPNNPIRVKIPERDDLFPDVEKALVTLIGGMLQELDPPGFACTIPPENTNELLERGVAIVTVQRAGGPADRVNDFARVHISVTTLQRSSSWEVLGWLRVQLPDKTGKIVNPDGTVALIQEISELQGPQKTPQINNDMRTVNHMMNVHTRKGR